MRTWWATVVGVPLVLLSGACGGDSSEAGVTVSPTTSESPAKTEAATVAPTTTIAAPTTLTAEPVVDDAAAVEGAYLAFVEDYWACLRAPTGCAPAVLTAPDSPASVALGKTVNDLISAGLHIGANAVGYTAVESVVVDEAGNGATVTACWWDTGVLYGPSASDGGPEVVMNDLQVTARYESTMALVDGEWRLSEERRLERIEGENRCPPES